MLKRFALLIVTFMVLSVAPSSFAESWSPTLIDGGCYDMTGNPTYCGDQTGIGDWWKKWFGGGGAEQPCPTQASNCRECLSNCECQFEKNKKQCNNNITCIQTATLEFNACKGGCVSDYDGC
ncbi:MAG TPA: hypothetical protein VF618_09140 [Thermoanaerobaculia bacterium]